MRIIAGKHRGRKIEMLDSAKIRPTSSRTRESIFNILSHGEFSDPEDSPLIGRRVVDLFCGTGALGLEALSRGAAHVTFIDQAHESLALSRKNAEHMGESEHCRFMRSDSSVLPPAKERCHLALIDPPYRTELGMIALSSLHKNNWLEPGAVIVLEQSTKETHQLPPHYTLFDQRKYGNTTILLLRYQPEA